MWIFCTTQGQPHIKEDGNTSGFDSQWQRTMKKNLESSEQQESFTEHDLCAKAASDVETVEEAVKMRGHMATATTKKVYRRKPNIVMPFNSKKSNKE
jgi:hypothetical protein